MRRRAERPARRNPGHAAGRGLQRLRAPLSGARAGCWWGQGVTQPPCKCFDMNSNWCGRSQPLGGPSGMRRAARCPVKYVHSHCANLAAVLQLGKRHHMDEGPEPEGEKPGKTSSTRLQDGEVLSHYRHVAFVEIAERTRFCMAVEHCRNVATGTPALLDHNPRHPQRSAASRHGGRIADDEYSRLIRYVQERANTDPAGMVCF
jgi:hypothetical protein